MPSSCRSFIVILSTVTNQKTRDEMQEHIYYIFVPRICHRTFHIYLANGRQKRETRQNRVRDPAKWKDRVRVVRLEQHGAKSKGSFHRIKVISVPAHSRILHLKNKAKEHSMELYISRWECKHSWPWKKIGTYEYPLVKLIIQVIWRVAK